MCAYGIDFELGKTGGVAGGSTEGGSAAGGDEWVF